MHPAISAFEQQDNCLLVGGTRVDRLAQIVGRTPFFAYDRTKLDRRVAALRQALPAAVALRYAVKANPMPAIVQHLAGKVDGFDIASAGEMQTALDTTIGADHISFAGPGKTNADLTRAVAAGVMIELESFGEADRVTQIGEQLGLRPKVAVRVNPDFQVKGSGMRMGGGPQQFGVDVEQVPDLLAAIGQRDLDFQGFHVFAGSQNLRAESIRDAQYQTLDLILKLVDHSPAPIRHLNLGGSFGIPYFAADVPLDLSLVGDNLAALMRDVVEPNLPSVRVTIELGRYIVGECGVYVSRVVEKKMSRGKTYLVVDGGLNHHLPASGNFGQAIRKNYPLAIGNRMPCAHSEQDAEVVNVVGCLCTPLDLLGENVSLPQAEVGDLVVLFQSGAYGPTASPSGFLGHQPAAEVLV